MPDMKKRIENFRKRMTELDIEAAFITDGADVRYLSGFAGTVGDASLFILHDKLYILTDTRYTIQAGIQCPDYEILGKNSTDIEIIAETVKANNISKAGFENLSISYRLWNHLVSTVKCSWSNLDNTVGLLRNYKDNDEIEYIARACEISCESINELLPYIKAGVTENELSTELEYRMKKKGASGAAFDTIVASGARSALPHGLASEKKLEPGDAITFDFGALFNGYCADMTRTFFLGYAPAEMEKIYNIVLEAQLSAEDGFRYGMVASDLDKIARDIIESYGYGKEFGHSLGHGVGLEIHEGVAVSKRGTQELTEGMVFSVEPGIYVENLGGVRIEDLTVVQNGKLRILTNKSEKTLAIL